MNKRLEIFHCEDIKWNLIEGLFEGRPERLTAFDLAVLADHITTCGKCRLKLTELAKKRLE